MRCFVAVVPPEDTIADLDAFLAVRRDAASFRWTDAEQLHLTLAFLPEVAEWRLEELSERLSAVTSRCESFSARIAGGGAFPHADAARVLWAGLEVGESALLDRLVAAIRGAANHAGVTVDGTRFHPHLTVARLGRPQQASDWVKLLDAYRGPEWLVDRIVLIRSHLGEGRRRRPRYEELATLVFGADR